MKRRIITLALALSCMFVFPAISYADDIVASEGWVMDEYVDDFGDSTGSGLMKTIVQGTFDNTATTGAELTTAVFFDAIDQRFSFRLLEYNDTKATYTSGDDIKLLFKVNDTIYESKLFGNAPNNDLFISDLDIQLDKLNDYSELTPEAKTDYIEKVVNNPRLPFEESIVQQLSQFLSDGNDVRCIIYIGASKYNFTLSSENFSIESETLKTSISKKMSNSIVAYLRDEETEYPSARGEILSMLNTDNYANHDDFEKLPSSHVLRIELISSRSDGHSGWTTNDFGDGNWISIGTADYNDDGTRTYHDNKSPFSIPIEIEDNAIVFKLSSGDCKHQYIKISDNVWLEGIAQEDGTLRYNLLDILFDEPITDVNFGSLISSAIENLG